MSRLRIADKNWDGESAKKLAAEARRPMTPEERAALDKEVSDLEAEVGMSIEEVRAGLNAGTVKETLAVVDLLMTAARRDLVTGKK